MSGVADAPDPAQSGGVPTFGSMEDLRKQTEQLGQNPGGMSIEQSPYQGIGVPSARAATSRQQKSLIGEQ